MIVAVTDYTFPDLAIEREILEPLGCEIVEGQCKTGADLVVLTGNADFVITQFAPVDAGVIAAMNKARLIVRYGVGYDNVDIDAARERHIPVCNIPEFCIDEVADHTLAFILAATRNVLANCQSLRGGEWGLAVPLHRMLTMRDLTVGIIGMGRIGGAVAARLTPFKCRILVHDPAIPQGNIEWLGGTSVDLNTLLETSDVVSLHCPSTDGTRHLIRNETIERMKPGAILINLGRGDLVDTVALTEALTSGHLSAAALDVFDAEPLPTNSPLLAMGNVVVSSHIASASAAAAQTLRETAAKLVATSIRGETLPNVVNGVAT